MPQPQRADTRIRCEGSTAFEGGDRDVTATADPRAFRGRGERSRHHLVVPSCRLGAVPDRAVEIVRQNIRECSVYRTSLSYWHRLFNRGSDQRMAEPEAIRNKHAEASIDDWFTIANAQRGSAKFLRRLKQFGGFPILQCSSVEQGPRVGVELIQPCCEGSFEPCRQRERPRHCRSRIEPEALRRDREFDQRKRISDRLVKNPSLEIRRQARSLRLQ